MKKSRLLNLISLIENELRLLDRLKNDLLITESKKLSQREDRHIYEGHIALQLHNFYNGVENIFKQIANELNGGLPSGDLLRLMSHDVPELRPAIISEDLHKKLSDYLGFRHAIRNMYSFEIDSDRLQKLIDPFENVYDQFRNELRSFIDFLRILADNI